MSKKIDRLKKQYNKDYGEGAASTGADVSNFGVIPTGILSLDYALGTGGWVRGAISHIYAPADIGKSNCIGLGAVREAQKLDLVPIVIAIEPGFDDPEWMIKHGVDPEEVLVLHPESGEEAVDMAIRAVRSGDCDLMVFDSVGALLNESEQKDEGKTKAGGQSGLVARLVKNIGPSSARHRVASILLNQVRANFNSPIAGSVKYPGGYALDHMSAVHVRLRFGQNGKRGYTIKEHGEDVTIGRQVIAIVERNKFHEGSNHKAVFDFYIKETNGDNPFGVDSIQDVINTGKRVGAIDQAGAYYTLPDTSRHQGAKALEKYISENPKAYEQVRDIVLGSVAHELT